MINGNGTSNSEHFQSIIGNEILENALSKQPSDGGLWTDPKLTKWMSNYLGYPVGQTQGWRTLRRFGYTLQVPKPANTQADKKRRADLKKSSKING